jgi:hypothetical protein
MAGGAIGWLENKLSRWVYPRHAINGINFVNSCGTLLVDGKSHDRGCNNVKRCWKANPSYLTPTVEGRICLAAADG